MRGEEIVTILFFCILTFFHRKSVEIDFRHPFRVFYFLLIRHIDRFNNEVQKAIFGMWTFSWILLKKVFATK